MGPTVRIGLIVVPSRGNADGLKVISVLQLDVVLLSLLLGVALDAGAGVLEENRSLQRV